MPSSVFIAPYTFTVNLLPYPILAGPDSRFMSHKSIVLKTQGSMLKAHSLQLSHSLPRRNRESIQHLMRYLLNGGFIRVLHATL